MAEVDAGALSALGWDERALALFEKVYKPGDAPARAVRVQRGGCVVATPEGPDIRVRSELLPVVGDWLVVSAGEVRLVLARRSALCRGGPSARETQVLAANIDIVLVTVPADRPNLARAERELALAWASGAVPLVVLTKAELPGAVVTAAGLAARLSATDVVATSTRTGQGLEELRAALRPNRTAVLLGPSGAGKSSLTNVLVGSDVLVTGSVRQGDGRGRHTTTFRQLVALPGGGALIDTPGLRSLGLTTGEGLGSAFPDIRELSGSCRFVNCGHAKEPGCAVLNAVAKRQLGAERLASYQKLLGEAAIAGADHDDRRPRAQGPPHRQRSQETVSNKRRGRPSAK